MNDRLNKRNWCLFILLSTTSISNAGFAQVPPGNKFHKDLRSSPELALSKTFRSKFSFLRQLGKKIKTIEQSDMDVSRLSLTSSKSTASTASKKIVYGSDDKLFGCIERNQRSSPLHPTSFGTFLDAGTGSHSLRWIASLLQPNANTSVEEYTAVTADEGMRRNVLKEAESLEIDSRGTIAIGNWAERGEDELCQGQKFDTILCDYLVGAMDGFSPYYQDEIFPQLVQHLNPGGRIYVVGLNPIPDKAEGDANIICKVTKVRDACILLAGDRCYREYPLEWIERHLERSGLEVVSSSQFPILYSHNAIVRQLNVARSKLSFFPNQKLAKEMSETIDFLEQQSLRATSKSPGKRLRLGFDYVVTAQLPLIE